MYWASFVVSNKNFTENQMPVTLKCDQIERFIGLWATFQGLPKSPTFLGNFCKGVKIYNFLLEIILGNFYRHLAIFLWSHCFVCALEKMNLLGTYVQTFVSEREDDEINLFAVPPTPNKRTNKKLIPGFDPRSRKMRGHRTYHNYDPNARIQRHLGSQAIK